MARIHILLHSPNVSAGTVPAWAASRGHDVFEHRVHLTGQLPSHEDVDVLFSMGGPMGVYQESEHPWIADERNLLAQLVDDGTPVIGICLGAQLLASALGGDVAPHAHREIGWWPVVFDERARQLDWLSHLESPLETFMWHGDRYELPPGAVHLASSNGCDNHAFVTASGRGLGVQFHPEFDAPDIEQLVAASAPGQISGQWVQDASQLADPTRASRMREWFWELLDRFLASTSPTRAPTVPEEAGRW